jgi:hypothetical protein
MKKAASHWPAALRIVRILCSACNDWLQLQLNAAILLFAGRGGVARDRARFTDAQRHDALAVHAM